MSVDLAEYVVESNLPPPSRALDRRKQNVTAYHAVRRAGELAVMVRDESRETIAEFLDRLDRQGLYGLVVALAAMVPDDVPQSELLAWVDGLDVDDAQLALELPVAS